MALREVLTLAAAHVQRRDRGDHREEYSVVVSAISAISALIVAICSAPTSRRL
jgi:hypothetical protein